MRHKEKILAWILAPIVLGACAQIVGIEDPIPIKEDDSSTSTSSSGNGSSSSGSSSGSSSSGSGGAGPGPWVNWKMPNPVAAGLPNKASYSVDMTKDIVTDHVTNLIWQRSYAPAPLTWEDAITYCENLELGGYTNWRLPWRIELVSLIDYTKSYPAIDGTAFLVTPSDYFWTASTKPTDATQAWIVNFIDGDTFFDAKSTNDWVRCVRSE